MPLFGFLSDLLSSLFAIILSTHSLEVSSDLFSRSHYDFLGAGSTGEVFAARLLGLFPLALKLGPWEDTEKETKGDEQEEEAVEGEGAAERLRREVEIYQALSGTPAVSCIPRLISHDFLMNQGMRRRYIATSLIRRGRDLGHTSKPASSNGTTLTRSDAISFSRSAFSSLLQLHLSGAAHNDISESNVIVDHNLRVWLLDLDLAELDAPEDSIIKIDYDCMTQMVSSSVGSIEGTSSEFVDEMVQQGQQVYLSGIVKKNKPTDSSRSSTRTSKVSPSSGSGGVEGLEGWRVWRGGGYE